MNGAATTTTPGQGAGFEFTGQPDELYYFAYGANMNPEQIAARCSNPRVHAVARLAGHRVGFYDYAKLWDGALETVIGDEGSDVWGVVYALSEGDKESLDSWQDARMDGAGPYFHYPAVVTDAAGKIYRVLFYVKDYLGEPTLPSREYLEFIIRGAEARGLPADYIAGLRKIESKPAGYPVPRKRKFTPGGEPASDCSACDSGAEGCSSCSGC